MHAYQDSKWRARCEVMAAPGPPSGEVSRTVSTGHDLLGDTERERTRRGRRGGDPIEPSARIGKSRSPEENPTPPEPMSESDVSRLATFFSLALVASVSPYWFARQFS